MYSAEEFDCAKTKILKYILYKKRTEQEVKNKFWNIIDSELLQYAIEELKQVGYIDDNKYIKRAIDEYMALNNMSIKEIKYKLLTKGIDANIINEYIDCNYKMKKILFATTNPSKVKRFSKKLLEYEIDSAKKIVIKKSNLEKEDIKNYLIKKGYNQDSIKEAI